MSLALTNRPDPASFLGRLFALPRAQQLQVLRAMSPDERNKLRVPAPERVWDLAARPNQMLPPGDWINWLVMSGRGFGKTRIGAETVRKWVRSNKFVNIAGPTSADVRDVMVEGESGILAICPPDERPEYEPSKRKLTWPNGCVSLLFSGEEPERFRGPQMAKFWADELAAWKYAQECWDLAMFGLRLGDNPQTVITTTPKPTKLIKEIMQDPATIVTRGSTYDNKHNLANAFYKRIIAKYEGTRLGRQEIHAEVLDDNPNALWQRAQIDALRVKVLPPNIRRVVLGVDPAVSANEDSAETGIVGCAADLHSPPHFYVVDDVSDIYTPAGWGNKIVDRVRVLGADRVIAEINNGGDLVEANIRSMKGGALVPYKSVHASRGKTARAEPVAALYEQGRVHHVGSFAKLEDEMCDWDPRIPADKQRSPNRMDAMVWAIWELAELDSDNVDEQDAGIVELGDAVQMDALLDEFDSSSFAQGGLL